METSAGPASAQPARVDGYGLSRAIIRIANDARSRRATAEAPDGTGCGNGWQMASARLPGLRVGI